MEHVDIPDGERHEVKGATTAANGQFLKALGNGSTEFETLTLSNITDLSSLKINYNQINNPPVIAATSDSTASTLADFLAEYNAFLAKLRASGLMET